MITSEESELTREQSAEERRDFVERWAEYVRTHDDEEWSRQQNELIDSQLQTAREAARRGDTDPVAFAKELDRRQRRTE